MIRHRTPTALVLALAGSVAMAGCSSDKDTSGSSSSSSSTTASANSATSSSSTQASGTPVDGKKLAGQLTAALQKAKTFTVKNDTAAAGQKSTTKVQVKGKMMDASGSFNVSKTNVDVVALNNGAQMYAKSVGLKLNKWTKLDTKSSNPAVRQASNTIMNVAGAASPWNSFTMLSQLKATKEGEETVDGVKATKYTAQVPAKMVLAATPAAQRSLLAGVLGDRTTPLVQYVDAQGRPVKQTLTLSVGGQQQAVTTTWSDFGKPVKISAPA